MITFCPFIFLICEETKRRVGQTETENLESVKNIDYSFLIQLYFT